MTRLCRKLVEALISLAVLTAAPVLYAGALGFKKLR